MLLPTPVYCRFPGSAQPLLPSSDSFSIAALSVLNSLPSGIRACSPSHTFCHLLKTHCSSIPSVLPSCLHECLRFSLVCHLAIIRPKLSGHRFSSTILSQVCQGSSGSASSLGRSECRPEELGNGLDWRRHDRGDRRTGALSV